MRKIYEFNRNEIGQIIADYVSGKEGRKIRTNIRVEVTRKGEVADILVRVEVEE